MGKTKIDWCDEVWNPVWGCLHSPPCSYCYARKMAKRICSLVALKESDLFDNIKYDLLVKDLYNFKPTWIESNFQKKLPKNPKRIFANSMSDIAYWKPDWTEKVLNKIKEYPQHTFMFLTKTPNIYFKYDELIPENCMIGFTATNQETFDFGNNCFADLGHKKFVSIEPIQEQIEIRHFYGHLIIVGAETGKRKGKIIPEKKWIDIIAQETGHVFMKDNLRKYYSGEFRQEFPEM